MSFFHPKNHPLPFISKCMKSQKRNTRDENLPISHSVICLEEEEPTTNTTTDTSHLLWDSPIFPTLELEERSISSSTILNLLASDDKTRFTHHMKTAQLVMAKFRLQVDGGTNRLVANNMDYFTTSWQIEPYQIGGIGAGITCTAKGIFHIICSNGSIVPVEMFYSREAIETIVSPTDTVYNNSTDFDSW